MAIISTAKDFLKTPSSTLANKAMNTLGLGSNLGIDIGGYASFTEWFYNVLLVSSNSVPVQALWYLWFDTIPQASSSILHISERRGSDWGNIGDSSQFAKGPLGMIFAQAVDIPGDGFGISRIGLDQNGFIKGPVGERRN